MIDFFASEPHYVDHLVPTWRALGDDERGEFRVLPASTVERARHHGVDARVGTPRRARSTSSVLVVAAHRDLWARSQEVEQRVVLVEHGAGQTYVGMDRGEYSGGAGREPYAAFLCPSPRVARNNLARYPETPALVVGSPRVDELLRIAKYATRNPEPTVAVSFHWPCRGAPEAGSAWRTFLPAVRELVSVGRVLGHGHPRMLPRLVDAYRRMGVEIVPTFEQVVAEADVYACDNSSTMYEFAAATGRPVVAMNAPEWRRDVEHGLRFWSHVPGPQVDRLEDLRTVVEAVLGGSSERSDLWERAVEETFPLRDGEAALRSADVLRELARERRT